MKKFMYRFTALFLALVLLTSQMALPVMADSTTPDPNASTSTPDPNAGTPEPDADGNIPAPQAIGEDTPLPDAPGDTYDADQQTVTNPDGSVTDTLHEQWKTTEETNDTPTQNNPAQDTTENTTGNTLVTKEGEQTTTTHYGPDKSSQSITGQEDIDITDTDKSVTTTTDVTMTDTNTNPVQDEKGSDTTGFGGYNQVGDPVDNEVKPDDSYTEVSGSRQQIGTTETEDITVPEPDKVELHMEQTPANPDTDVKKFTKEIHQILPSEGFKSDGSKYGPNDPVTMDGKVWNVTYDTETQPDPNDPTKTIEVVTGVTFTRVASAGTPSDVEWDYTNAPDFTDQPGDQPQTSTLEAQNYLPVTPGYTADEGTGTAVTVTLPEVTDYTETTAPIAITDSLGREGTRTITAIYEDDDPSKPVIGYKIVDQIRTTTSAGADTQIMATDVQEIPAYQPTAKPPVTQDGMTITQSVSQFTDANGKTAWRLTTITTNAQTGDVLKTEVHEYFSGTSTTDETIVTTPTSDERIITTETIVKGTRETQTTEREINGTSSTTRTLEAVEYDLVTQDDGIYLKYEGHLYKVVAGAGHGDVDQKLPNGEIERLIQSLQPKDGVTPSTANDLRTPTAYGWNNGVATYDNGAGPAAGYEWKYFDYGWESRFQAIHDADGADTTAHQFILKDSQGNEVYVYCMDVDGSAQMNHSYDMENIIQSGYTNDADSQMLQMIAANGYWGTASGTGSLGAVKEFLWNEITEIRNGTDEDLKKYFEGVTYSDLDSLTGGIAITATQAALWYYGRSDNLTDPDQVTKDRAKMMENIVGDALYGDAATEQDKKIGNALFRALVLQDVQDSELGTEFLNEDNFATEATLEINGKVQYQSMEEFKAAANTSGYGDDVKTVTDDDGNITGFTDAQGNDLYNVKMKFTVMVKQSDFTGNFNISVIDKNGHVLATKQARSDDSNFIGKMLTNDSCEVVFENLVMADNVDVTVRIDGTQKLQEGAYLYTADGGYGASQTFIGVAWGERKVNLEVTMGFDVTDPTAAVTTRKVTWEEEDVDTHKRVEKAEKVKDNIETSTSVCVQTKVKGTRVATKMVSKNINEKRRWNSYMEYLYSLVNDEDGGPEDGLPGEGVTNGGLTIPDEAVPLAAAPKTGDISQILATICLVSLGCAYLLARKERRA